METLPAKNNNTQQTLQRLSQKPIVMYLQAGKMAEASALLPSKIEDAVNGTPISEIAKVVEPKAIEAFLAIELTKLQSLINVDERLNLQAHQVPFLASTLIELFPNESLADFVLCFKRGAIGQYGQIFRLDAAVVTEWMRIYLDEKYEVREYLISKEKAKEKQELSDPLVDIDKLNGWFEKLKQATGYIEQKPENVNETERIRYKHPSRMSRNSYINMLWKHGLEKLAKFHYDKSGFDWVYNFKIEDQIIVAKDQDEANEIFIEMYS